MSRLYWMYTARLPLYFLVSLTSIDVVQFWDFCIYSARDLSELTAPEKSGRQTRSRNVIYSCLFGLWTLPTQLKEDCHALPWRHSASLSTSFSTKALEIGAQFQGPVQPIRPTEFGPHGKLPRKITNCPCQAEVALHLELQADKTIETNDCILQTSLSM